METIDNTNFVIITGYALIIGSVHYNHQTEGERRQKPCKTLFENYTINYYTVKITVISVRKEMLKRNHCSNFSTMGTCDFDLQWFASHTEFSLNNSDEKE